jgi:hypothetical protein
MKSQGGKYMADLTYRNESLAPRYRRTEWGAIWGGVFTYLAIWLVFGSLGLAIFASASNPTTTRSPLGMSVGLGIWAIVLTILAMYVAGRETARLAAVSSRHDGLMHGMIMFGLSMVATFILMVIGGNTLNSANAVNVTTSPYVITVIAELGWMGFASLFLGWLAALFGASSVVRQTSVSNVHDIRNVA